jgi:hypothetical protein
MPGSLLVSASLKVAEDQRHAKTLGKAVNLFVQESLDVVASLRAAHCRCYCRVSLMPSPLSGRRTGEHCSTVSHLLEPRAQRIAHPESTGFLHKNEERGLEGVIPVVGIDQDASAYAQNHRSMPLD